jgi:hypothetical protein
MLSERFTGVVGAPRRAIFGILGALPLGLMLPSRAMAQNHKDKAKWRGQRNRSDLAKDLNKDTEVAMVVIIKYDGTVDTHGTETGKVQDPATDPDTLPDDQVTTDSTLRFLVHEGSDCVTCVHNGVPQTICK